MLTHHVYTFETSFIFDCGVCSMHGWGGMYVLVWGLEDTLDEMGVDVEDFKMDVRKQR